MASKMFMLAVIFGTLSAFLSILALSLNYWQGRTLLFKELMEAEDEEKGNDRKARNIQFNSGKGFDFQFTTARTGSFRDMQKLLTAGSGVSSEDSLWSETILNIHGGIWHWCVKLVEIPAAPGLVLPEGCLYLENIPGVYMPMKNVWVDVDWAVPRAMLFLGMFSMAASVVCVLLRWFMLTDRSILLSVASGLAFIAGLFFLAGFSVFADKMKLEILDYQSAFYFCILSWLLSWVTGGIIIYTRVANKGLEIA